MYLPAKVSTKRPIARASASVGWWPAFGMMITLFAPPIGSPDAAALYVMPSDRRSTSKSASFSVA